MHLQQGVAYCDQYLSQRTELLFIMIHLGRRVMVGGIMIWAGWSWVPVIRVSHEIWMLVEL